MSDRKCNSCKKIKSSTEYIKTGYILPGAQNREPKYYKTCRECRLKSKQRRTSNQWVDGIMDQMKDTDY